jgi:nicotinamidase-related amidase
LVIDMQKEFFDSDPAQTRSLKNAIQTINEAIALFRDKNLPVVCVQHINEKDGLAPGSPGFEFQEEIHILPGDLHIHKTYGNSFNKTPLPAKLQELGVDTVILSGFCAEFCVLATSIGAEDVDLMPVFLRGGLASGNEKNIRFVESLNEIISTGALEKALE